MSGGLDVLAMKEDDVTKMLAAGSHLGDANVHFQMASYVYKTKSDGTVLLFCAVSLCMPYFVCTIFVLLCRYTNFQSPQDMGEDFACC